MILTCVVRIHFISFMECAVRPHQKHFYEPFRWKPEWRARAVVDPNVEHRRLQHKFTNLMRAPAINSQSMEKSIQFSLRSIPLSYLICLSQIKSNLCNTLSAHSSIADKFSAIAKRDWE